MVIPTVERHFGDAEMADEAKQAAAANNSAKKPEEEKKPSNEGETSLREARGRAPEGMRWGDEYCR